MDKKAIVVLIFILFAIIISIMQATGMVDITTMFNRVVKQEKPEQFPEIEFIKPPAHGYHEVYYNGKDYYTYVIFKSTENINYAPSVVTSFPLKGNPILLAKYKDKDGRYVYELLLKASKMNKISASVRINQYLITFYPEIVDVTDKWGIEILSPNDGETFDLATTTQITVYVLNKYNDFVYKSGTITLNGQAVNIISSSLLTEEGEKQLTEGVTVASGDVMKFVIDLTGQSPGQKTLETNIETQSHGTLKDSVTITLESTSGSQPGEKNLKITNIYLDGQPAQNNNGVYEIPVDSVNTVIAEAQYNGDPLTSTNVESLVHSTPRKVGILQLEQYSKGKLMKMISDLTNLETDPLKLNDNDMIRVTLSRTDLEAVADGNVHTLYLRIYDSSSDQWIEASVQVKLIKANLKIQLLKPVDKYQDPSKIDEVININDLRYGLYEFRFKNIGERAIKISDILVKLEDVNNPQNTYVIQPASPVEGMIVDVNKEAVFYINFVNAGIPSGVYKVTLLIFDKYQSDPVEAPEHPTVQLIVPTEKVQIVSPQPNAIINANNQKYINVVVKNSGEDPIQIRSQDGIRFIWDAIDENGNFLGQSLVIDQSGIVNYDDIINTYSTFNPGDQFTATIQIPTNLLDKPVKYFVLAVEIYKPDSTKLTDSVQPIIIYKQCSWSYTIYSVTDDSDNPDPLTPPDVWDKLAGAYKEIILKNNGDYPIKFSANDIVISLEDANGNTITLPILNKGSLSPDSGTTYWYPGKTLQLVTSIVGVPPGVYTLKVTVRNYMYCAEPQIQTVTRPQLEVKAPKSTCGKFLTIQSPQDNTYIDLSKLDPEVNRAGIMRVKVNLDTVGLAERTGESEFKLERVSVVLKDTSGNIVYMFTPRTEILNYDDVVSQTYTPSNNNFELIIDAGGLVHAGLLNKPLTLEVSAYIPGVDCYDFDNKDNIYFIYPQEKVFDAVLTKYAVPSSATPTDIQYSNGEIISPTSITIPEGTQKTIMIYAVNDGGDYDKDGKKSEIPMLITSVGTPRFYDPVHGVTYYAKFCQGSSTNNGILWTVLLELKWCIDFSSVPPTEITNTGQVLAPNGYTLILPVTVKDETTQTTKTIYLTLPHIHIQSSQPPTTGFTPVIISPEQYTKYPVRTDQIIIAIKRPSTETNTVYVDLTKLRVTLLNKYTGETFTFPNPAKNVKLYIYNGQLTNIPQSTQEWEQFGRDNSDKFVPIDSLNPMLELPGGQDSYIILKINPSVYKSMLPSYYIVKVNIEAVDSSDSTITYPRELQTIVKLTNDDGTGNPVVKFTYPLNGQTVTLNLEQAFAGSLLYAGVDLNLINYLPALKDTLARTGLSASPYAVELIFRYFKDFWARQNYKPAVDLKDGNLPPEVQNVWYWKLQAKDLGESDLSKYVVYPYIIDLDNMGISSKEVGLLRTGIYDPSNGIFFQIFQSVIMADKTSGKLDTQTPEVDMKGVIRTIITDMSPDRTLTIKLMAKPEGMENAPDDPELFPTVTFKLDIITSTKPYIEYPSDNIVKVGIQDFQRTYDWNELTQMIGQPQGDLASDYNTLDTLRNSVFFYSYGDDSYNHNTYVRIFNPAGVNTILTVEPILTTVDPIYLQAFKDLAGNTFSIAPGIIMRENYNEWEPDITHRQKLPLEIYYYPIPNTVKYKLTLKDAVTGEIYDEKYITIVPYNTGTPVLPFTYIQPQTNDNIDVWKLSDQILLTGNTQNPGSKLSEPKVYAGETTTVTEPLYLWSYIQARIYFNIKQIKAYVDGNPVQIKGVRIIDTSGKDIPYKPGIQITPGMSIGVKIKIGEVTATIDTLPNGGKRITSRSFTYEYPLGKHKLRIEIITTDEQTLKNEVQFNIYNSQGKQYMGRIIYPRPLSQITPNEYYNNQLIVSFENLGEEFTYSSIIVKVNGELVTPNSLKLIKNTQTTGTGQTLTQGTTVNTGDVILMYLPTDKLFTGTVNRVEVTIYTSDGNVLSDKTVFVIANSFYMPYKRITILNIKDASAFNIYYTDKIITLYTGYSIMYSKAKLKVDDNFNIDLTPVSIIRNGASISLTQGTQIQDGDILIFQIPDKNKLPIGFHTLKLTIMDSKGDLIQDSVKATIYNQDWGTLTGIHITSPDKKDYLLSNKPIIITAVNEKAPFTVQSYTITIDGQQVTPQKALKLGLTVEPLQNGVTVNHAETIYFEIDPTAINLVSGAHTITVTITKSDGSTVSDTKTVFLYDPLTPSNIILLNPTGSLPNLLTSLIALGCGLIPSQDNKYIDLIIDWYPVSFTWDKGQSPMTNIKIVIDNKEFTYGNGIDQVIIKTREGTILQWTPDTADSITIKSGDIVTAYLNFNNFEFHLFEYNPETGEYSKPVPHTIKLIVNGKTVKGQYDENTGKVTKDVTKELEYKTTETIEYVPTYDITWKKQKTRYLSYLEEWTITTPIYYSVTIIHPINCRDLDNLKKKEEIINKFGEATYRELQKQCCMEDKLYANKHQNVCKCMSPKYASEHPKECVLKKEKLNGDNNDSSKVSCEPEYSQCCAVKSGKAEWSDFYKDPSDIMSAKLVACICDLWWSLFGMGCGCCEGEGHIPPIPDGIPDYKITLSKTETYCAGSLVTRIWRLTNYVITSGTAGNKVPAGSSWTYVVNGQKVDIGQITVTTEEGAKITGYGVFINGYNPYVVISYNTGDIKPNDNVQVQKVSKTIKINLPSSLPLIDPKTGQTVTSRQYVKVDKFFIKGVCKSDMKYRIKKLLDYTITTLIPEIQYGQEEIRYTDQKVLEVLSEKYVYQVINGELNIMKVLPFMDYPTESVPYWLYPEDFKVNGFMIPIHVTVYNSEPGEQVANIHLYYDGTEVPQDKYLPIVIRKTDAGVELIPYDKWDKTLDSITQFYIIYIPDRFELGRHEVKVTFDTSTLGTVGVIREFEIRPAFNWELLLTSVPDTVYKEFGTTIPVYIKNKGMSFRFSGLKAYIDGVEVPVTNIYKVSQDKLVKLNTGDYVDVKDTIMFPLDISALPPGKHELKVIVTTGFKIDVTIIKQFSVENEMKIYKISITSPTPDAPLLYDEQKQVKIYVKNDGDAITYGGLGVTINNKPVKVISVKKLTESGLVQINDGDTINSEDILVITAQLPSDYEQLIPLQETYVSVGILNKDNNEIIKDATKTLIGSKDLLSNYKIKIQSPRQDTALSKSVLSSVNVYVKNEGLPITISNPSDIIIKVDGVAQTLSNIKIIRTDGTVEEVTGTVTINTGDTIVTSIPISSLEVGTHKLEVIISGVGKNNNEYNLFDTTMFTVDNTVKDYSIRISSPKWKCPLILPEKLDVGVPVYITVTGQSMSISNIEVNVNGYKYTPENVKIGTTNSYSSFTPGTTVNHFDLIVFTIPQEYFNNNAFNIITVSIQTNDGHIVTDTVKFALVIPSIKDYIQLVMPQNGQTYIRTPLKTTSVTYHDVKLVEGSNTIILKRAENRFFYGVKDTNTLINSYNELIALINKYNIGGEADQNIRNLISSNPDIVRPFIQMIEWDADIEDLYQFATPGATLDGFKNFLQFYIDASKFRAVNYDPNIVMRFKIVDPDAEKLGKFATISWRGLDGKVHSTNLIMYKGIVIPEEVTLFDFIMKSNVANMLKVTVPVFYGFDYSGKDKVYQMQVEIIDKSVNAVLDKKKFKLVISGKRFKQPVGFRLVYPMSIFNDYYKTAYTPISEWVNEDLPVYIEWYDYLYKFDPVNNNWFMGFNWIDKQGQGHMIGIGKDDTGFYYKYDDKVVYVQQSDIQQYINTIMNSGMVYNTNANQPDTALLWFPQLSKFEQVLGWSQTDLDNFKKSFIEESHTPNGKVGTNFVFIVYTATNVETGQVEEYNFADKGHIIWGYNELSLELEPKYMDIDSDKIPDYIITPDKLEEAMTSPVWQNNKYYSEAYNYCGDAMCMVNGYKLDKLAHKQVVFTLKNKGSLIFNINDIRRDLKITLEEQNTGTTFNNLPIFIVSAPDKLLPRQSVDVWVVIDEIPSGKYSITASLSATAIREDWLVQFQEATGIDLSTSISKTEDIGNVNIPVKGCGTGQGLCLYYNRMVELMIPRNGQEVYLEEYHNSLPYQFKLYLDGQYILKEFIITLMKENKNSIFYLRYFDPQGGVVTTEELIQQGMGNPTYSLKVIMNPDDRNDWQYITKIISSTGDVSEQVMSKDLASVSISNTDSNKPVVKDQDIVNGQLGVPNFPTENIGLNIVSLQVTLENPATGEVITLKDANADVTIGRKVQPRDNILEISSPTSVSTDLDVPVKVVSTCVRAQQLMMMQESDLQIYSKENSDFIKQTLEGTCDIPFTEDYVNKKLKYIDPLAVGEYEVMYKIYDPSCNCVYLLPPEAWEHMRLPMDSGIAGTVQTTTSNTASGTAGISLAGGDATPSFSMVTQKVTLDPFNMNNYNLLNAGGYAWYMNQTTLKVGYGYSTVVYLDDAIDKMLSGKAVWNRASWYIMFVKNSDGTGSIVIKYAGKTYSFKISNMADFLGFSNDQLVPIQGYLTYSIPSIDQILDKAKLLLGETSQTYQNIEYALEHIKRELVSVDENKIVMFTYTGNGQGEDYNEYMVSLIRPEKYIRIINIADGTKDFELNRYTLPLVIVNQGTKDITMKSAHIEIYDTGDYKTTPFIVESDENVDGVTLKAQTTQITLNFNLKNYLLKTGAQGSIKKLVLVVQDADGDTLKYPVYDISVKFSDNAFTLIYPDGTIIDALRDSTTGQWYIPIKLKVIYEYIDDTTGEVIRPTIHLNSITVQLGSHSKTITINKDYNYGDTISVWFNPGALGTSILTGQVLTIKYSYTVNNAQGTQPDTVISGATVYPSTGYNVELPQTTYTIRDLMLNGIPLTLTNALHKPIIQANNGVTTDFQLSTYTFEYTIENSNGVIFNAKYYPDHVEWTFHLSSTPLTYTLTYKTNPATITGLQPQETVTYNLYGLNNLLAESKVKYNEIMNNILQIASIVASTQTTVQFKFTYTFVTQDQGAEVNTLHQTLKYTLTLNDYDPVVSYPTSNSLLYIPKAVNQISIIMYNMGKNPLTIDLSSMSITMGNINLPLVYVKDSQGNTYTTGTVTISGAGGTNTYIIIRVDTSNVIDGLYNLNINFNTQEAGQFNLKVTNLQVKKVDEVTMFEPEWDTISSQYTTQYGNDYITLPMTYPPEYYGTFGDIEWKDSSGTPLFKVILYRIEPEQYDTPSWAGTDKPYSELDGTLTGILIDSLNNNDNILTQGESLGVMIPKDQTITVDGTSVPYSEFFKGINKIRLIYTNQNSDFNNLIVFTKYFLWDGTMTLWLDFKFNGWYFPDFNWRIPIEIDPTAQITSPLVGTIIKITLDTTNNPELKASLEELVDTDNDGTPDTPAWQTKQVGIRVTYYDPAFEDINGDGTPDPAEAEVPFYIESYDGTTATIYIKVPIIKQEDVGQRIINIYYYGGAYTGTQ